MRTCRYYQEDALTALWRYFLRMKGDPIVAMPTGTGKSLVIAEWIRRTTKHFPQTRSVMLTHVQELIEQNFSTLLDQWPSAPAGIYCAALKRKQVKQITYASIQSVAKKAHLFGHVDFVIIDECHLVSPKQNTSYRKFVQELKKVNPKVKVIGLSATPYRLGLGLLTEGGLFTDICYDITGMDAFNRLVDEGYLSPLIPRRTDKELDTGDVRKQGGEFVQKDLQNAVDREELTLAALTEARDKAADRRKWLIFVTGIEHANHTVGILDSLGIPAKAVHSQMAPQLRDEAIAGLRSGAIRALVNNNVLTTGFDCPDIDCIVVLRPTESPGLWVQMLGRGTRPVYADGFDLETIEGRLAAISAGPKQNCLVLDFAANTRRLGPINCPNIPNPRKKKGKGQAPVRVCEVCGTYNHASVRFCVSCNTEFPRTVKFGVEAASDELVARKQFVVEVWELDPVQYRLYVSKDPSKPPSLLVTYRRGLQSIQEWVCLEHSGFAKHKARDWWRERDPYLTCDDDIPSSIEEALERVDDLRCPTHLRVWLKKRPAYPEILAFDFTGTAFGAAPAPPVDAEVPF